MDRTPEIDIAEQLDPFFDAHDMAGAIKHLKELLRKEDQQFNEKVDCYFWLGMCCGISAAEETHIRKNVKKGKEYYQQAEAAYREALQLIPENATFAKCISGIILDQGRDPSKVIDLLSARLPKKSDDQLPQGGDLFEVHSLRMLIGTAYLLLGKSEEAIKEYRFALTGQFRNLKEPDLSSFQYFPVYNKTIPPQVRAEIKTLAEKFDTVNPNAMKDLDETE